MRNLSLWVGRSLGLIHLLPSCLLSSTKCFLPLSAFILFLIASVTSLTSPASNLTAVLSRSSTRSSSSLVLDATQACLTPGNISKRALWDRVFGTLVNKIVRDDRRLAPHVDRR